MAKIDRYNGNLKAFASDATGTERTIFGDTAQSDELDANITADLLRGWGVVGSTLNPTKQDFNGLGFTLGQLIAYLHQQGIPEWNTSQEYYRGSVVTTLAGIYRLKNGGDATVDPDNDNGTNWELAPTRAQVDAKANQATTYTKTEANSLLDAKADQATTYTETEVDNLLDDKANISGQAFSGNISAPNLSGTNTGDGALAIGVGQTWQDVTGSRAQNTNYTNSTGKPIFIYIVLDEGTQDLSAITVDGVGVGAEATYNMRPNQFIVPNGSVYRVDNATILIWTELR